LLKTLEQAVEFLGASRKAVVVREISKKFEQVHRGTLTELVNYFKSTAPKGEIVIVIEGYSAASEDDDFEELSEADILLRGRQKRKKA
jgi:16S rRNA (cytidine1402-2'-O)-methyltransferase